MYQETGEKHRSNIEDQYIILPSRIAGRKVLRVVPSTSLLLGPAGEKVGIFWIVPPSWTRGVLSGQPAVRRESCRLTDSRVKSLVAWNVT